MLHRPTFSLVTAQCSVYAQRMTNEPEQPKKIGRPKGTTGIKHKTRHGIPVEELKPALPVPMPRKFGLRRFNPKYVLAEPNPTGSLRYTIKPAGIEAVTRMAREGHDVVSIAATLGISPDTFKLICKRQPEVQEALDEGRASLGDEITDILLTKARKGETAAAIFLAKGRLHWREVGPVDPNQQAGPTINITIPPAMSPEQFAQMIDVTPKKPTDDDTGSGNSGPSGGGGLLR